MPHMLYVSKGACSGIVKAVNCEMRVKMCVQFQFQCSFRKIWPLPAQQLVCTTQEFLFKQSRKPVCSSSVTACSVPCCNDQNKVPGKFPVFTWASPDKAPREAYSGCSG